MTGEFVHEFRRRAAPSRSLGNAQPATRTASEPGAIDTTSRPGGATFSGYEGDYCGLEGVAQRRQGNNFSGLPQELMEMRGYSESVGLWTGSGTVTVDASAANAWLLTLTGPTTITPAFQALPTWQTEGGARARSHGLTLILSRSAGAAPSFPGVRWPSGSAPSFPSAASIDVVVLLHVDGPGWLGFDGGLGFEVPA